MTRIIRYISALTLLLVGAACGQAEPGYDATAHEAEVKEWREGRLERLLKPTGYLTQVGLYWIEEGTYTVGSGKSNDIVLPATADERVGELRVGADEIRLVVASGVDVVSADGAVTELVMPPDSSGENIMAAHGSIAWSVIERGGKLAVRVRDFEHPWIKTFGPLPYYDIDPKWRVAATLQPYDEPRVITVNTVIEGFQQNPTSPGIATFTVDGVVHELEAQTSGERLFFVFGDETNRDDTYGAGRYLYADAPGDDGRFTLDFNQAYSPPCAFNEFSTCPIASPHNRLTTRVEAGEKYHKGLHYSADSSY